MHRVPQPDSVQAVPEPSRRQLPRHPLAESNHPVEAFSLLKLGNDTHGGQVPGSRKPKSVRRMV
jgi:hypothetical protein